MALSFGKTLKVRREVLKLSVQELAEKSGVSIQTISLMESDETSSPSLKTIEKVAEALGMELVLQVKKGT